MAFTKITHAGIGSTGTVLLENLEVTGVGTFGGSVSVGGTLTYEDVTNIDSVGLITARNGIVVGSGITLSKDGDGFFTGVVTATSYAGSGANLTGIDTDLVSDTSPQLGGNLDVNTKNIVFGDSSDGTSDDVLKFGAGTDLLIYSDGSTSLIKADDLRIRTTANENYINCTANGAVELYYDNTKRFETTSTGVKTLGDVSLRNSSNTQTIIYDESDGQIEFLDNIKASFGTGGDLLIHNNGSVNVIDAATSAALSFRYGGSEQFFIGNAEFKGGDNKKIKLGTGDDMQLYHDGTTNYIECGASNFALRVNSGNRIEVNGTSGDVTMQGSGGKNFTWDNSTAYLNLNDNARLTLGSSNDLSIYHDGTNSFLVNNTGDLLIRNTTGNEIKFQAVSGEQSIQCIGDGAVELYYDGSKKLETFSTGVKMESSSDVELRITKTASSDAQIINDGALNLCCSSGGADGQIVKIKTGAATNSLVEHMRVSGAGHCQFHYFDSTIPGLSNTHLGACVEKISGTNGSAIFVSRADSISLFLNRNSTGQMVSFRQSGNEVGSISTNGNALPSDRNFKKNITDLTLGLNFVNTLKPSKFNLKLEEDTDPLLFGLIAQDVEEALTASGVEKNSVVLCQHNPTESEAESDYNLDYGKLIPVLINAIKELSAKVTALEG